MQFKCSIAKTTTADNKQHDEIPIKITHLQAQKNHINFLDFSSALIFAQTHTNLNFETTSTQLKDNTKSTICPTFSYARKTPHKHESMAIPWALLTHRDKRDSLSFLSFVLYALSSMRGRNMWSIPRKTITIHIKWMICADEPWPMSVMCGTESPPDDTRHRTVDSILMIDRIIFIIIGF